MKFSTVIVTFAAVASQAAAVREHHEPTDAFFKNGVGACHGPGGECMHAKRAAMAVADAIADPKKKHGGWIGFCGVPGQSCNGKRDPEAANNVRTSYFCEIEGTPGCNQKQAAVEKIGRAAVNAHKAIAAREAFAEADAIAEALADPKKKKHGGWIGFCGVPGESCNGKRAADAYADAEAKKKGGWIGYCGVPGQSCNEKRDAEADPKKHKKHRGGWIGFCGVPGEACNGKRDAVKQVQDAIRSNFPETEKAECHADGQPCDLILKAHNAFRMEARDAEAKKKGGWIGFCGVPGESCNGKRDAAKLKHCAREGCPSIAKAHLANSANGNPDAEKAERACYGPEGACTLAARAVEELGQAIDEGMMEVEAM